jgi:uncharacterized membrane protein YhaH (DUF805 family)
MFSTLPCLILALDSNQDMYRGLAAGAIALWFLFAIAVLIFSIYCAWRVATKCGYPGAYSLLLLIPIVNIIVQLIWVFSEWPIETELKRARSAILPTNR